MSRIRSALACFVVTAISLGQLTSCASMKPVDKSLYALDPGRPIAAVTPPGDPLNARQISGPPACLAHDQVVQVCSVNIARPFDGTSLIYRTAGGGYVKDYYSEWVAPPEELFTTQMVNWLSASGPFAAAVDARSAASHRYSLEACITSIYGDFQDPRKPRVVLTARLCLIDDTAGALNVAYQNHYDISIPLAGASAEQLVLGSGRAYRQLLESMTQDLFAFRHAVVAADVR